MKKKEAIRLYKFSDGKLILLVKEKVAFMRRDAAGFVPYGITAANVTSLETSNNTFSNFITDTESASDQTGATTLKDNKAEQVRVEIRNVMARAERKYGAGSAKYDKFGTQTLSKQSDAELLVTAKRVVRVGTSLLSELTANGLTAAMLTAITTLATEFETLLVDQQLKIADRDIIQEDRVEMGNAIYTILVDFCNTGRNIWETSDVAKYNDYIIYDTPTGEPLPPVTP